MPKSFIVMPISTRSALLPVYRGDEEHFFHVLDYLFVPALELAGFEAIRPNAVGADIIHASIIKNIEQADLVLCDMSGLNPNVFFELGIRTAVDKPTCMVVDDVTDKVPFDISIVNYHRYDSSLDAWKLDAEIERLAAHIGSSASGGPGNSMWNYFGLSARAQFSTEETGLEAKVDLMSMRLDGLARQITGGGRAGHQAGDQRDFAQRVVATLQKEGISAIVSYDSALDPVTIRIDGERAPASIVDVLKKLNEETDCRVDLELTVGGSARRLRFTKPGG